MSAQLKTPEIFEFGSAKIASILSMLAYIPPVFINNTMHRMNTLNVVSDIFFQPLRHSPFQLRWNHNRHGAPQVAHASRIEAEIFNRLSKIGIALSVSQQKILNTMNASSCQHKREIDSPSDYP